MDTLDSKMVANEEENGCRFEYPEKIASVTYVNSCQGKVAGVLVRQTMYPMSGIGGGSRYLT